MSSIPPTAKPLPLLPPPADRGDSGPRIPNVRVILTAPDDPAGRGEGRDRRTGTLRSWVRYVHPASPRSGDCRRAIPEAPTHRSHPTRH